MGVVIQLVAKHVVLKIDLRTNTLFFHSRVRHRSHRQSKLSNYHGTLPAWLVLYNSFFKGKTPLRDGGVYLVAKKKKLKIAVLYSTVQTITLSYFDLRLSTTIEPNR